MEDKIKEIKEALEESDQLAREEAFAGNIVKEAAQKGVSAGLRMAIAILSA